MRCLICNENFNVEVLQLHYQHYHSVNESNYFFKKLFLPDNNRKNCDECYIRFKSCRQRKNYNFLFQRSEQMNQVLPVNIIRRRLITCNSINFQQHFYDFYNENIADSFLFYSAFINT